MRLAKHIVLLSITFSSCCWLLFVTHAKGREENSGAKPVASPSPLFSSSPSPSPSPSATASPYPTSNPLPGASQPPNGISVGRPKVFDNRTLTLMLESLSESLRSVQSQFIDQKALAAAFAFLQGSRATESVSNFSISPIPVPSSKVENTATTGNTTATGTLLPDTTKTTTTSERGSFAPQPPALDTTAGFPSGFSPSFGSSPGDLLTDQVNLTYQIFNLRMILDRSLSDRLLTGGDTRRQAVLGFNVSIDPPRTASDAVAVVEIRLKTSEACTVKDDCLSLVALMPQEKTYNAAALSTKSHAFGASAAVSAFQLGFSERHKGQTFYLYRDNDTISYERMEATGDVVFGWMFRPVLGRHSVSPGFRQLFAIVALPSADTTEKYRDRNGVKNPLVDTPLTAKITTYWKAYDRATMTSFKEDEMNRGSRFRDAILFGLSKPEIFAERYTNVISYDDIKVRPTETYQEKLAPTIDGVWWTPVGQKSALISIQGNNFFTGTQVTLGDKNYATASDGLTIKSNQALDMVTGLDALASGSGALLGRYGPATPIVGVDEPSGIDINDARIGPSLSGMHLVEILLTSANKTALTLNDLPKCLANCAKLGRLTPIVTVNGNVVSMPYSIADMPAANNKNNVDMVLIQGSVPDSFLTKGGAVVKVVWPFRSDKWTATTRVFDPVYNVVRLTDKRIIITATDPLGFQSPVPSFEPCWLLLASGSAGIQLPSSTCTVRVKGVTNYANHAEDITIDSGGVPDKIVLVSPTKFTFSIDVPKLPAADSGKPKTIVLNQCDSAWKEVSIDDISKVGSVGANGINVRWLPSAPDKDGNVKSIKIELTSKVTRNPGNIDLTVFDKDGKILLLVPIQVNANPACKDKGDQ